MTITCQSQPLAINADEKQTKDKVQTSRSIEKSVLNKKATLDDS